MLLDVKTAMNQWCPMARANDNAGTTVNRSSGNCPDADCRCFADECMMWRRVYVQGALHGYCGLAGKPLGTV